MRPPQASPQQAGPGPDLLLLHVAKSQTFYPPLNVYQSCSYMAMGLLALAELADRHGYSVRVLHTGVEYALNPRFALADRLRELKPRAIGFSIQFHHGLVDAVQLLHDARAALPDAFLFAGGFTATFFAREMLQEVPALDAIVRGDAEEPLLQLLAARREGRSDLSGVANLLWRRGTDIAENEQSYVTSEEMLNQLVFTRFDLLDHSETYHRLPKAFVKTRLPVWLNWELNQLPVRLRRGLFPGVPVGRGCVTRCFYCSGGAQGQLAVNRRKGVIFRRPEKVIETMRELPQYGYQVGYISFDPHPWSQEYYVRLFRMMHEQGVRFDVLFSAWGLPTREFLDAFATIAGPRAEFLISPETGSETLRRQCRAESYTNAQLLETLAYADARGLNTRLDFCIGVPGDTEAGFRETVALKREIERRFSRASTEAFLVEVEPGAPWHLDPEKYGIRLLRRTFNDFLRDESAAAYSSMSHLGYTTAFFGDKNIDPVEFSRRLLKLRCRHFCEHRVLCATLRAGWVFARPLGVGPRAHDQAAAVFAAARTSQRRREALP